MPLIKNKKTVNPRDAASTPVQQLETAMGSAIALFDGASAVVVPRTRFAPVKTTNDLFVLRSDAYAVAPDATVVPTVDPLPVADLDSKHYKLVDAFEARGRGVWLGGCAWPGAACWGRRQGSILAGKISLPRSGN